MLNLMPYVGSGRGKKSRATSVQTFWQIQIGCLEVEQIYIYHSMYFHLGNGKTVNTYQERTRINC